MPQKLANFGGKYRSENEAKSCKMATLYRAVGWSENPGVTGLITKIKV